MKTCRIITAVLVLILCFIAHGCSTVAHWGGLATTDDVRAERDDQRAIDNRIAVDVADMHQGKLAPADVVDDIANVGDKATSRTYTRTEPQPIQTPPGTPPWVTVALGVITLAGSALAVKAHANTQANATQINDTKKSLAETDSWVGDVEKKTDTKVA